MVAGLAAMGVSCGSVTPQYAVKYAEKRAVLHSNGLRVIVMPDDSTELVEVDMRYLVGSREDPAGKDGLAHLIEHLMFDIRPPEEAGNIMSVLDQAALFYNAYTEWDKTHYQTKARKSDLEKLLKLEAERLFYGCETISPEEFNREREVVRNEIRQRAKMNGEIPPIILAAAYPEGHPYSRTIGGNDKTLTNITLDDACKFMKDYYVPERAILVVAGNVKSDDVIKLASKYFAPIPKRTPAPRVKVPTVKIPHHTVVKKLPVDRTTVTVAWALPPTFSKRGREVQLALGQAFGKLSGFAADYDFAANIQPLLVGGNLEPLFVVSVELADGADTDEALDFIYKAAEGAHRGLKHGTLDFFKPLWAAQFVEGLEPLTARTNSVADEVQFDHDVAWDSEKAFLMENLSEIQALDGDEMTDTIDSVFDRDKSVVVVVEPTPGAAASQRSDLSFALPEHDRGSDIPVDPKAALKPLPVANELSMFGEAKRFSLDNGMDVILLPFSTLPVVSATLMFNAGGVNEPADQAGLAQVAAGLRTPRLSEAIIKMRRAGLSVSGDADDDTTYFRTRGMNVYLEEILEGLERVAKVGKYTQEDIEDWQKDTRYRIKDPKTRDQLAFRRAMAVALYGDKHPYVIKGTPRRETIGNIDRDSAESFADDHYTAANATLVVAGSFDVGEAKELIEDDFGSWGSGDADKAAVARPKPQTAPKFIGVAGLDGEQVEVAIAYPSQPGIDGQYAARLVIAEMLNLRMAAVRKELGASYGVYGRLQTRVGPSAYIMGGMVDAARAAESLVAMRDRIDKLRKGEGFLTDFVRARRKVYKDLLNGTTVSSAVVAKLAKAARYGLPPGFYRQVLKQVAVMSPAQVRALIAQELAPAGEVVVALGGQQDVTAMFAGAKIDSPTIIAAK